MKQGVTDEEIERINSLYDSGKTMDEIALEVYLSKSTVYRYVRNPRKKGRQPKLSPEQVEELNADYRNGSTIKELTIKFDIYHKTATRLINDYHVNHQVFNTIDKVKELNRRYEEDLLTMKQLSEIYGVSPQTISNNIWHPREGPNQFSVGI